MMDKLTVDLDDILDEFEHNEAQNGMLGSPTAPSKAFPPMYEARDDLYSQVMANTATSTYDTEENVAFNNALSIPRQAPLYNEPYLGTPASIDLAEADFAPELPKEPDYDLNARAEGHFVPEDEQQEVINGAKLTHATYAAVACDPNLEYRFENRKPEIIQHTTDEDFKDMLDAEGYVSPSFFSNSPPNNPPVLSQPDVVPTLSAMLPSNIKCAPCHDYGLEIHDMVNTNSHSNSSLIIEDQRLKIQDDLVSDAKKNSVVLPDQLTEIVHDSINKEDVVRTDVQETLFHDNITLKSDCEQKPDNNVTEINECVDSLPMTKQMDQSDDSKMSDITSDSASPCTGNIELKKSNDSNKQENKGEKKTENSEQNVILNCAIAQHDQDSVNSKADLDAVVIKDTTQKVCPAVVENETCHETETNVTETFLQTSKKVENEYPNSSGDKTNEQSKLDLGLSTIEAPSTHNECDDGSNRISTIASGDTKSTTDADSEISDNSKTESMQNLPVDSMEDIDIDDLDSEINRVQLEIDSVKEALGGDENRTSPDGNSQQEENVKVSEVGFHIVHSAHSRKLGADSEPVTAIQNDGESCATLSDTDSAMDVAISEEKRDSIGSAERFLLPPVEPPVLPTPMVESGFSKIPGFASELNKMLKEEDEEMPLDEQTNEHTSTNAPGLPQSSASNTEENKFSNDPDMQLPPGVNKESSQTTPGAPGNVSVQSYSTQHSDGSVRPKEIQKPLSIRKSRPNSLLGLSTPELPTPTPYPSERSDIQSPTTGIKSLAVSSPIQSQASSNSFEQPETFQAYRLRMDANSMTPMDVHSSMVPKEVNRPVGLSLGMPSPVVESPSPINPMAPTVPLKAQYPPGYPSTPPPAYTPQNMSLTLPSTQTTRQPIPSFQSEQQTDINDMQRPQQRRPNSLTIPPRQYPTDPSSRNNQPSINPMYRRTRPIIVNEDASAAASSPAVEDEEETSEDGASEGRRIEPAAEDGAGAVSGRPIPSTSRPAPPPSSANPQFTIVDLGKVAPRWIPDAEAPNCMQCEARFTFTKRRHHCRACGKVFCSVCCNLKYKLKYLEGREARVCSKCYQDLIRAQVYERMHPPAVEHEEPSPAQPNPNNPSEYCSTIPPTEQVDPATPPPTVMVPTVGAPAGVLKRHGSIPKAVNTEAKSVMFSDGIRPGGDLTELDGSPPRSLLTARPRRRHNRNKAAVEEANKASGITPSVKQEPKVETTAVSPDGLPPVIMARGDKEGDILENSPAMEAVIDQIVKDEEGPILFALNKNLAVYVDIVDLDCCVKRKCWAFTTEGMCTVGQDEIIIVLECGENENKIPLDIFLHLNKVYEEAQQGTRVTHMGVTIFNPQAADGKGFLEGRDHGGFLYVRPTFQCLQKITIPSTPFVFAILISKWEIPWAKIFPLRLLLRLGAEYRYYPCPLMSVRFRKPVYQEIGHTIVNLLADLRNFQYSMNNIRGVTINMETKKTTITFPCNRYDDVMKVLSNSNEHVMSFGSNFSQEADSHLVCMQSDDGSYHTQAINIQNRPRVTTGASFVVFNGALKPSTGLKGKSSIVEDGLMVQLSTEDLASLKQALKNMQEYVVNCGPISSAEPDEVVILRWGEDDKECNAGVKSPIDNFPMDGIESAHIHNIADYKGPNRAIRWTEVFFLASNESETRDPVDASRLAETLATASAVALVPHLDTLKEEGRVKIGLRVNIDSDNVGYLVGSKGEKLSDVYMNSLDNELIPVIHNAASQNHNGSMSLELFFYVIET